MWHFIIIITLSNIDFNVSLLGKVSVTIILFVHVLWRSHCGEQEK